MHKIRIVFSVFSIGKIHVNRNIVNSIRKIRSIAGDVTCWVFIKIFKLKQTNAEELKTVNKF